MKKFHFFVVGFISFSSYHATSIKMNLLNYKIHQKQDKQQSEKQGVPYFDESNSPKFTWINYHQN
jgi:hypothetical protein